MLRHFVLAFLILSVAGACAGPCEELANIICDCDEDPNQRSACRTQVATDLRKMQISEAENQLCLAKKITCTRNGADNCAALRNGDRNACGFTKE